MGASVRYLDKTGNLQLSSQDWSYISAGAVSTATKFFIENNGTRSLLNVTLSITQVGLNDGYSMGHIGADILTVISPYGITGVAGGSGGTFSTTGFWYYRITATNVLGETIGSTEISVSVTATTQKVTLEWVAPIGATGYKIYRSQISGDYTSPSLLTTISSGSVVTFLDSGTSTSAGTLPTENTTSGGTPNYGTSPSLGSGPVTVGTLAVGQQSVFWMQIAPPLSSSEIDNPRVFRVVPNEN